MIKRLFTDHPRTVGETYTQHMGHALTFAASMAAASLACLVHAIFPAFYRDHASRTVDRLHGAMVANRRSQTS